MKTGLSILLLVLWWNVARAQAHRLDEFLQATTVAVGREQVRLQVRLTPGVAVAGTVLADLDADGDGVISEAERRAYAERVRADLSLAVDGQELPLRPGSQWFPPADAVREGLGEILLSFDADVPPVGPERRLVFENRHRRDIATYLVNCLVPDDPGLLVTAQSRSFDQSSYRIDYAQAAAPPGKVVPGGPPFAASSRHEVHRPLTEHAPLLLVGALALAAFALRGLIRKTFVFRVAFPPRLVENDKTVIGQAEGLVRTCSPAVALMTRYKKEEQHANTSSIARFVHPAFPGSCPRGDHRQRQRRLGR